MRGSRGEQIRNSQSRRRRPYGKIHNPKSDTAIVVGLALLLFGLTMLVWSGRFHSSDGLSMYAAADSLARYGRFDVEQIRWMDLQQGTYGPDGLLYSRKGLGTTILVYPLVLAGILLPGIGPVHAALLLTPLLTALSGVLLYVAGRRTFPSVPRSAPVLAVLAWGLGSLAWPYSKTLFSDPVVAFAMIGAFERFIAFQELERAGRPSRRAALGLGFWLALGMLTRVAHAVVIPIFGLALLWILWQQHNPPRDASRITHHASRITHHIIGRRWRDASYYRTALVRRLTPQMRRPLLAFLSPLLTAGLLALWYNWLRFGNPFNSGYLPQESFSAVWWRGIVGQLVSPGRGLLWYVPWLALVVPALRRAWRRASLPTVVGGLSVLAYLALYGKWYMWHGGFAWGPRFLVPTLPLLAWLAVPAAARWRWSFGILALLGAGINLIGVAWNFQLHQQVLIRTGMPLFDPRTFFDPQYAQIPGLLRLGRVDTLDVAWMVAGRLHPAVAVPAGLVALLGFGAVVPLIVLRRSSFVYRRWFPIALAVVGVVMGLATYVLLWRARAAEPAAYHTIVRAIEARSPAEVMLWHDDPDGTEVLLNLYEGRAPILGANVTSDRPSAPLARRLPALAEMPRAVWVVSDGPAAPANALDRAAMRQKGFVEEITADNSLRAALYFDTDGWQTQQLDVLFQAEGQPVIHLLDAGVTPEATAGGIMAVRLRWEALVPIVEDYQIFVHLLGPAGMRVAQHDGPAQHGLAPTSAWQPGVVVRDVHAMRLPADSPSGECRLVVGLYRLSDLRRLVTPDGRDVVGVGRCRVMR